MEAERWFHRRRSAHKPPRMADHNPSSPFYFTPWTWHGIARANALDRFTIIGRPMLPNRSLSNIRVFTFWNDLRFASMKIMSRTMSLKKKRMRMTFAGRDDRSSQITIVSPLTNSGELATIMSPTCSPGWHESVPFNDDESSHKIGDNLAAITLRRPNNYVRAIRF